MSESEAQRILDQNKPSGPKLLIYSAITFVVCLTLGAVYGMYFMEIESEIAAKDEEFFRLGMGATTGFYYFIPLQLSMIIIYVARLWKAARMASAASIQK